MAIMFFFVSLSLSLFIPRYGEPTARTGPALHPSITWGILHLNLEPNPPAIVGSKITRVIATSTYVYLGYLRYGELQQPDLTFSYQKGLWLVEA